MGGSKSGLRMFPILVGYKVRDDIAEMQRGNSPYLPVCIPWEMLTPHERQAETNHYQSLERLAQRGGLCASEALAVLEDRRWRSMPLIEANERLCGLMAAWIDAQLEESEGTPV